MIDAHFCYWWPLHVAGTGRLTAFCSIALKFQRKLTIRLNNALFKIKLVFFPSFLLFTLLSEDSCQPKVETQDEFWLFYTSLKDIFIYVYISEIIVIFIVIHVLEKNHNQSRDNMILHSTLGYLQLFS